MYTPLNDHLAAAATSSPPPPPPPPPQSVSPQAASFMAFTGFDQDIVAKDARQAHHSNSKLKLHRAVLPTDTTDTSTAGTGTTAAGGARSSASSSSSLKGLLRHLRAACDENAGSSSIAKTDLAQRIASQLERVAVEDLLIAGGDGNGEATTYEVEVVVQIFEWYVREQSWGASPPQSPRGSVSTGGRSGSSRGLSSSLSSSLTSSLRSSSTSSVSSSDLRDSGDSGSSSGSSVRTGSRRGRSVSSNSDSDSESGSSSSSSFRRGSDTGSSISGSSLSSSFRSTTSESSATSIGAFSESSSSSASSDDSVKLEKKAFYVTESSSPSRKTLLPPTTANFKVGQLLESYLEEVAKDSSLGFALFTKLAQLFTEFPRDSDDSIYRALDGFLRTHPSLTDTERMSLCRLMDPGALSLAACVHAASNERLPVRVIVQLLFSEQIKLRNEMTGNDVINGKDLGSAPPSFSTSTTSSSSTTDSSSDATPSTLSSGSSSTSASSSSNSRVLSRSSSSSRSISSASDALNELALDIRSPRTLSVASSPLLGGLSVKNTMRFVLAEIESLRKSVQEMESVKSRLSVMETLQLEMELLASKFQDMSQDYVGMTQQVEELTRSSKHAKSGWSSGWKKMTKSFQSKDSADHKLETPPLPPVKLLPTDFPNLPILRTKSETLQPRTSRADSSSAQTKTTDRADSLPVTTSKTDSAPLHPKTPRAGSSPKLPKGSPDSTKREALKPGTPAQTPRDSVKSAAQEVVVKCEATPPSTSKRVEGAKLNTPVQTPRDSFNVTGQEIVVKSETITPPKSWPLKTKEGGVITSHRSHHVEDGHRRSVRSRSTSPEYIRSRYYKDSDSMTSTSSYSKTSSGRGGHQYRNTGRNGGSMEKHRSHESEKGLGHELYGAHRKHRQKEGSHNGQSQLSGDAQLSRHSSVTHQSHQSGRHRQAREGSLASHHTGSEQHSGSLRSEQRRKDRRKEHRSHRRHQSFSDDSTASSGIEGHRRREHRT